MLVGHGPLKSFNEKIEWLKIRLGRKKKPYRDRLHERMNDDQEMDWQLKKWNNENKCINWEVREVK